MCVRYMLSAGRPPEHLSPVPHQDRYIDDDVDDDDDNYDDDDDDDV